MIDTDFIQHPKEKNLIPNLLVVGVLLYYVISSLSFLIELFFRYLGIGLNFNNYLIFISSKLLPLIICTIITFYFSKKIWKDVKSNSIGKWKYLILMGTFYIIIQFLQFIITLYQDFIFPHSSKSNYYEALGYFNLNYGDIIQSITLKVLIIIVLFIQFKRSNNPLTISK